MDDPPICILHGLYGLDEEALAKLHGAPLLGQVVGDKYALVDMIGSGGVGAVYHGLQLPLGRPVAVKVLRAQHMRDEEHKARFWHEAKALSQLKSSHTVQLFDFGVVPDGPLANVAYMVMELVDGRSLAAVLGQHGPLPPTYIADVVAQASLALTEAHRLGIVHRDLKPGNLMIMESPEGGRIVKVIDYGLAMSVDQSLEKPDTVMGTFKYVAPEQVFQKDEIKADHRVDIYSMACVCWKLLVGRAPIENDSWQALLMRKMDGPPDPLPGSDDDARLRALNKVLCKALMPHPEDRHGSMAAFAEDFFAASLTEGGLPRTDPAGAMPPPPPLAEKIPTPSTALIRTPRPEPQPDASDLSGPTFQTKPVRRPTPQAIRDAEERRTSSVSLPIVLPPSPLAGSPTPIALATLLLALALFVLLLWGAGQDGMVVRSTKAATAPVLHGTPQGEAALPSAAPGEEGSEPAASAAAEEAPLTFPTTEVEAPPPAAAKRKPRPAVKPKRRPKPAARRAPKPKPRRAPVAKRRAPPKPRPAVVIPDVPPEPTRTAAWAPAPAAAPTPLAALRPPPAAAPKDAPVDLSRPTKAVIAARAQSAAVARALRRCACEDAKARAEELQSTPEGRLLLRTLRPRVSRCQVPDVDERCVDGRVVD